MAGKGALRSKRSTISDLPRFVLGTTDNSPRVRYLVKAGRVRRFGGRLYTSDLRTPLEQLGRQARWEIIGLLCPGTVVSHRTALETGPAPDASVFVTADYHRNIKLPGLIIRQLAGPGPLEGDSRFANGLFLSSQARAFLENLEPSRGRGGLTARALGPKVVEQKLAEIITRRGADDANAIRDLARRIAPELHAQVAFDDLNRILSGLLATHEARENVLRTRFGRAVAIGEPYDLHRVELFDRLVSTMRASVPLANRPLRASSDTAFANAAFFDAYFSNYIEGTRFTIDEAHAIVFEGEFPSQRPADAHDIIGTYRLVSDRAEMQRSFRTFDDFSRALVVRHVRIMEGRPEVRGGSFKDKANQAGASLFVAPGLVIGTLRQGWELLLGLEDPGARALFVMFLVTEIHPFDDGNGRVARVMMNGELLAGGQERLIVPSVFRNEYLAGLRRLSNHGEPSAFIRVMDTAHEATYRLPFDDFERTRQRLQQMHAFDEPSEEAHLELSAAPTLASQADTSSTSSP